MKKLLLLFSTVLAAALGPVSPTAANVEVFKSIEGDPTEVDSGEEFNYVLQYRNPSTTIPEFFNVTIVDQLPAGVEYRGFEGTADVDSVDFDAATRTLTVRFNDPLEDGKTGELKVRARFTPGSTPDGTVATNQATIDADNSPADTSDPVSITARASNRASVDKTLLGNGIPLDQDVTYRVRLRNQHTRGALDLSNVSLVDQLPAGAVFVDASGSGVYNAGAGTVTWTTPSLDAGQTFSRTVTVRFPAASFAVGDTVTNGVSATFTPLGGSPTTFTDSSDDVIETPLSDVRFRKNVNDRYVYDDKEATKNWSFDVENKGNVPLDNVVVTDDIPDSIDVTRIRVPSVNGTPPGLNDPVNVFYRTNAGGASWSPLPGNPYSGNSSEWVDVSSLGLAAGDYITGLRWALGTLPVGYKEQNMQFRGTILTVDRGGNPIDAGDSIDNDATITYTDFNGGQTETNGSSIPVKTPRPVPDIEKTSSPSNVDDGGTTTFRIELTNENVAARDLREPVLADLLDEKLVYVPGSWQVESKPTAAPLPVFEQIDDYNGSGRTLLRWSWTGTAAYDLPIGEKIVLTFDAEIPRGTIFGNIENRAALVGWANPELDTYYGVDTQTDGDDLDGDGNTSEQIFSEDTGTNVNGRASMDSIKWVKGQLDSSESRFPDSGETVPGGLADYRLVVENTGNVPIQDAKVLDILPIVGDTGVVDISPRDTEWVAALAGPVTAPPGVTVYYSREENPERPEFKTGVPGTEDPLWSTTPPATITEARSLYFVFDGVTVQPGEEFELNWPMRAPVGTPTDGRIAWNSFGYFGTRVDTGSDLLASEPNKVGIKVLPDNNASYGDYVWLDADKDGIQDPGEPGLNGIRVDFYEDGDFDGVTGGFPDGVRDRSNDRHVGFTVTANDFNGDPGYYLFPDLDRGDYYAVFSIPDTYTVTGTDAGSDDSVDSDIDRQEIDGNLVLGYTPITTLDPKEHDRTWDLGLWLPPTSVEIVKTAGSAADGDDLWVLPGSPVTYSYTVTNTGDLPLVRIDVTDDVLGDVGLVDGPLAPGASVTVTKTAPSVSNDVLNTGAVVAHPASPSGVEIPGAPSVTDDDPANVLVYASIGDYVWYDIDLDGIQDPGESPVPGVVVTLFDAAGTPIATDTTGANGRYLFPGLLPGDYSLGFDPPAGYVISGQNKGTDDAKDSDVDPSNGRTVVTTLVSSEQDRSWDAGLWKPSSLGDTVWLDANANGIQDPGEDGVNGIVVNLLDGGGNPVLDGSGNPLTTTTGPGGGSDGFYEFTGLVPGSYQVEFELPVAYIFSPRDADSAGIDGGANSDADKATGITATVSLGNDEHNPRIDAGLIPANPEIELTKTVSPTDYDTDGQVLVYSFVVENTGNVPLTDVTVTDPLFAVSGGPIDLAVGEVDSSTFSGTYAVGLAELNAGSLPNTAEVTSTDPRTGDPVTDTDDALANAIQLPALSITKSGTYVSGAGPCNPFGVGDKFNALIFGSFNATGGDTDARLAVAGDVTINGGYSVGTVVRGDPLPVFTGGTTDMFIVGGDLVDGRWGVNGNVVHQGTRTGPVRVMPNGNVTRRVVPVTFDADGNVPGDGSGKSFADLEDEMQVRSALLGAFAERGVVSVTETTGGSGVVALDLVGDDPELNIFHLTADQLSLSSAALNLDVPAGSTTLVNVYGDSVAIHDVGMTLAGTNPRKVLFNLVDATSVETSGFAWLGSVLAPYADADFSGGSIDGRAVFGGDVVSVNGFEFHNFPFTGGICFYVEYEFTVANTGNVTITDIQIDDPVVTVDGGPIDLDPGESDSTTFTAKYLLKAADIVNGSFTNTATASGQPPFGARVDASDSDTQTFTIPGIGSGGTAGTGGTPPGGGGAPVDDRSNGDDPDLEVTGVSFLPNKTTWSTGEAFTAVVEVENKGLWKAEDAVLRFWNDKSAPATVGEPGEAEVHLGTMEIGETRTVTVGGFATPGTTGTYKLRVFVDADATVEEQSEGNNQLTGTYYAEAPASTDPPDWMKPDFVVQSVELDPSPTVTAAEFDVVVRVLNEGDIAGDAGTLAFWESSPSYHGLAPTPDQTVGVGTVDPGEIVEFTFPGLRAPENQGTYHARVVVDWNDVTEEYSSGNNDGGATYTVFPVQAVIETHPDGMSISWNSANGYTYHVERSTSLTGGFVDISGPLPATPPENVFVDDSVPSGGTVFYRVWGER